MGISYIWALELTNSDKKCLIPTDITPTPEMFGLIVTQKV